MGKSAVVASKAKRPVSMKLTKVKASIQAKTPSKKIKTKIWLAEKKSTKSTTKEVPVNETPSKTVLKATSSKELSVFTKRGIRKSDEEDVYNSEREEEIVDIGSEDSEKDEESEEQDSNDDTNYEDDEEEDTPTTKTKPKVFPTPKKHPKEKNFPKHVQIPKGWPVSSFVTYLASNSSGETDQASHQSDGTKQADNDGHNHMEEENATLKQKKKFLKPGNLLQQSCNGNDVFLRKKAVQPTSTMFPSVMGGDSAIINKGRHTRFLVVFPGRVSFRVPQHDIKENEGALEDDTKEDEEVVETSTRKGDSEISGSNAETSKKRSPFAPTHPPQLLGKICFSSTDKDQVQLRIPFPAIPLSQNTESGPDSGSYNLGEQSQDQYSKNLVLSGRSIPLSGKYMALSFRRIGGIGNSESSSKLTRANHSKKKGTGSITCKDVFRSIIVLGKSNIINGEYQDHMGGVKTISKNGKPLEFNHYGGSERSLDGGGKYRGGTVGRKSSKGSFLGQNVESDNDGDESDSEFDASSDNEEEKGGVSSDDGSGDGSGDSSDLDSDGEFVPTFVKKIRNKEMNEKESDILEKKEQDDEGAERTLSKVRTPRRSTANASKVNYADKDSDVDMDSESNGNNSSGEEEEDAVEESSQSTTCDEFIEEGKKSTNFGTRLKVAPMPSISPSIAEKEEGKCKELSIARYSKTKSPFFAERATAKNAEVDDNMIHSDWEVDDEETNKDKTSIILLEQETNHRRPAKKVTTQVSTNSTKKEPANKIEAKCNTPRLAKKVAYRDLCRVKDGNKSNDRAEIEYEANSSQKGKQSAKKPAPSNTRARSNLKASRKEGSSKGDDFVNVDRTTENVIHEEHSHSGSEKIISEEHGDKDGAGEFNWKKTKKRTLESFTDSTTRARQNKTRSATKFSYLAVYSDEINSESEDGEDGKGENKEVPNEIVADLPKKERAPSKEATQSKAPRELDLKGDSTEDEDVKKNVRQINSNPGNITARNKIKETHLEQNSDKAKSNPKNINTGKNKVENLSKRAVSVDSNASSPISNESPSKSKARTKFAPTSPVNKASPSRKRRKASSGKMPSSNTGSKNDFSIGDDNAFIFL